MQPIFTMTGNLSPMRVGAVSEVPNHGPCAVCGKDVMHVYPWWTRNPEKYADARPVHGECYFDPLAEALKNPPPIPAVTELYARAAAQNSVSDEDDTVTYTEPSSGAPEPPCHCDILELTLGKGHEPDCPHYRETHR